MNNRTFPNHPIALTPPAPAASDIATAVWSAGTRTLTSSSSASYSPQPINTANASTASVASTDIVNVTEAGFLSAVALRVTSTVDGNTSTLDITVDGGTTQHIKVYTASNTWDSGILPFNLSGASGSSSGNALVVPINITYSTSLHIAFNVTGAGTIGAVQVSVMRSKKN